MRGRKGEYRKEMAEWQKAGFTRVRIDGTIHEIDEAPALDKKYKHDIEIVVDRLVVRADAATRLAESFETALKLADGLAYIDPADPVEPHTPKSEVLGDNAPAGRIVFSEKFACPISGFTIAEIEPRLFSFNAPQGACPACDGLGEKLIFDEYSAGAESDLSRATRIARHMVAHWGMSPLIGPVALRQGEEHRQRRNGDGPAHSVRRDGEQHVIPRARFDIDVVVTDSEACDERQAATTVDRRRRDARRPHGKGPGNRRPLRVPIGPCGIYTFYFLPFLPLPSPSFSSTVTRSRPVKQ